MKAGIFMRDDVHISTDMLICQSYRRAPADWESACGMSMSKLFSLPRDNYDSIIKNIKAHQGKRLREMRNVLDDGNMAIVFRYIFAKDLADAVLARMASEQGEAGKGEGS